MEKYIVHNPLNSANLYYRDYNYFFDQLTNRLREKYDIIENRTIQEKDESHTQIKLMSSDEVVYMLECEYIIENVSTGDFYVLSVSDQMGNCVLSQQNNIKLKKVLYSQYIPDQIVHHTKKNYNKFIPWIYFQQDNIDLEKYYLLRKQKKDFIPNLFFKGNRYYRPILDFIDSNILTDTKHQKIEDYFENIINYEICLSIGGLAVGDICYRDIECMALGIPILKFEFVTTLNPGLIPNYHYISIPIPEDLPKFNDVYKDRLGNEEHAKLISKRFYEVINNKNYLNFISENARKYYETYLSKENRVNYTLNLLGL